MSDGIIASIAAESDNLSLHVQLCEQRYIQLISKFDVVDRKFEKLEAMLIEIKTHINDNKTDNTEKYLKWGGAVIFVLSSALIGVVTHLLFKA